MVSKVFSLIVKPNQEWMQNKAHQRPPYARGYGSSNSKESLGLTHTNDELNELSITKIQKA
jgi:hypothetical protein